MKHRSYREIDIVSSITIVYCELQSTLANIIPPDVQAQDPGAQVEADHYRCQRRRVDMRGDELHYAMGSAAANSS
jgi:hypothetical protein